MRAVTRLFAVGVAAALLATTSNAQSSPRHEFGVDLSIASTKSDGASDRVFSVNTPVDVRIGFVSQSNFMLETRFSLAYGSSDGNSFYAFRPGLNALWRLGEGTGMHNQMGAYLTAGASFALLGASVEVLGTDVSESQFIPGINLGIGMRSAMGSLGFRMEGFFAYDMEGGSEGEPDFVPSRTTIGVRIGLSVWH